MLKKKNEVAVNFSGGSRKNYVVAFDEQGDIVSIESVVARGKSYCSHRRLFWHRRRCKPLSALGLIVAQSAARIREAKRAGVRVKPESTQEVKT